MRLKLTAPLHSRDGTLAKGARMKNLLAEAKGARMKNLLAEAKGAVIRATKRPGLALLLSGTAMQGQGSIALSGALYVVSGDVLRKIIVSPPSASTTWPL